MSALVLMCGVPASGKTTIANRLRARLKAENRTVVIVSDGDSALSPLTTSSAEDTTTPSIPRQTVYRDARSEKQGRARLRALGERELWRPGHVVIVDSLNYIKGFRYELYCVAKTASASYAVIHTKASSQKCAERDANRRTNGADAWGEQLLTDLNNRFETPNGSNRWDHPLFTIDTESDGDVNENIERIVKILHTPTAKLNATMATREQIVPTVDAVADIDAATRAAESVILGHLRRGDIGVGDSIRIPDSSLVIRLQRKPRAAELRDMRRAFLNYSRMHPPDSGASLVDAYVQYVNEQLTSR